MKTETKTIEITGKHLRFLEERGINEETVARLGWLSLESQKGEWIAFPFFRGEKVVNRKYRTIAGDKKFYQDSGGEQCFYNMPVIEELAAMPLEIRREQRLVITEGEFDCAIATQCGYFAVSVPSGAPDAPIADEESKKFDFLADLPEGPEIILAVDGDKAGQILREELAKRIGAWRCKAVKYPKECKDLNEVFLKFGSRGVAMTINDKAEYMHIGGIFRMNDLPAVPDPTAYSCGIDNLEECFLLREGDCTVVTGIPSFGKTTFANEIGCNMASLYEWNVTYASFEQNPRADHLRMLRTYYIGQKRLEGADGFHHGGDWTTAEVTEADLWINRYFSFIVPDINTDELTTLDWVLDKCRAAIARYKTKLLIIDPWNELDHDRPHGMSLTEYTGFAIKQFKRIARQYMIHIIVVAHPSKLEKNKDGSYSVPTLYDISDSAHWYNKFDIGIVIHRFMTEKNEPRTLIRVAKVRYFGKIGKPADKFYEFMPHRARFAASDWLPPKRGNKMEAAVKAAVEAVNEPAQKSLLDEKSVA